MKKGLIDLDEAVVNALDLFSQAQFPKISFSFKKPLVVGSGNAAVVGRILFSSIKGVEPVFANESDYIEKLKNFNVDGAVLISSSGRKHAPIIAKELKKKKIKTFLLTNNENALAKRYLEESNVLVFPSNPEPYTYNTSTYLGMLLSFTREDVKNIKGFISKLNKKIPRDLKRYDSFYFIVPEKFDSVREMFTTKFDELFGSKISGRCFTYEQTKHAKTVVPNDKELFVGFGVENKVFGKRRLNFEIPKDFGFVGFIAVGYYLIGKIQKQNPDYFKKNIGDYLRFISNVFGEDIGHP